MDNNRKIKYSLILLIILLQGCQAFIAAGVHPENYDSPDVELSTGLAGFGVWHEFKDTNITGVAFHGSGVNTKERNSFGGFNFIGGVVPLEFK